MNRKREFGFIRSTFLALRVNHIKLVDSHGLFVWESEPYMGLTHDVGLNTFCSGGRELGASRGQKQTKKDTKKRRLKQRKNDSGLV